MASVGRALYGEDVAIRALPSWDLQRLRETLGEPAYLAKYKDGHLERVSGATATN
jgi:hypothetical protein